MAAKAYDRASHKRRGLTASLNFPAEISNDGEEELTQHKTSKYRGVSFCRSNKKWKAVITFKGKQSYLGYFTSEEEAAKCYDKAAREHRGHNALTNFATPKDSVNGISHVADLDKERQNNEIRMKYQNFLESAKIVPAGNVRELQKKSKSKNKIKNKNKKNTDFAPGMEYMSISDSKQTEPNTAKTEFNQMEISHKDKKQRRAQDASSMIMLPDSLLFDPDIFKLKVESFPSDETLEMKDEDNFIPYIPDKKMDGFGLPFDLPSLDAYFDFAL